MSSAPQQQPQHYAFVASSDPLELPILHGASSSSSTADDSSSSRSGTQEALVSLYQSYAERFPNPRLIEEYQERDQLLQATSAAAHAASYQSSKRQKGGGLFGFLFGNSSSNDDDEPATAHPSIHNRDQEEEDFLVYTEVEDDDTTTNNADLLCGTNHSLDRTCIPQDAHSMARLVLASTRTRKERPHVVRTSPQLPSSRTFCIVGLGLIADWNHHTNNENDQAAATTDNTTNENNNNHHSNHDIPTAMSMQSNHWSFTSDREDLVRYASTRDDFDLSLVRAAALGSNFLLISWGFRDGVVVLYRRIIKGDNNNNNNKIAWEPIVFLGPSKAVQEHSFDLFAEDDQNCQDAGSDLLRVTDMVPLVVSTPMGPAVAMAISRLGGYMEVFPVPGSLWYGPPLDASKHKPRPSANNKRKRKSSTNAPSHYAKPYLVNIASDKAPIEIMALTTMDYHLDILCLEAIRTRVTMDTVWDREHYGNAPPPAEYILVASGTQNGHEILTFWAVTFLFAEEPPRDGSAGFTLQANLQEALDVMAMGADLSIFVNRAIMNQWRHPRKVSLKEQPPPPPPPLADGEEEGDVSARGEDDFHKSSVDDNDEDPVTSVYDRVTTITTSAPIVSIQAIVVPIADEEGNPSSVVMLSLLDWNGSVTVMDCSLLERMISHSLSQEEYKHIHDADMGADGEAAPPDPIALVKTVVDRSRMMQWMKSGIRGLTLMHQCVSAQWLARSEDRSDPWLILLTSPTNSSETAQHKSRAMILSGLLMHDEATKPEPVIQTVPFPTAQATLQGYAGETIGDGGAPLSSSLLRIVFPPRRQSHKLCVCFLQPLQPREIILSLARDGKDEKAIEAAAQLSSEERQQVGKFLEECRQKLWERTHDLKWFKQVTDVAYIIQQALTLFERDVEEGHGAESMHYELLKNMDMDKCREICLLALQRTTKLRLASALAVGHGVEEARDKLQGMVVSMGTFQLLCRALQAEATMAKFRKQYEKVTVVELAKSFAPAGDVAALSILWFRHGRELHPHKLEILNLLPLTLAPRTYCHLLPIIPPEQHENNDKIGFFISDIPPCDNECLLHISQLPTFLRDEVDVNVVLDFKDEKMVLERTMRSESMCFHHIELHDFYLARAQSMQRFVGKLQDLADLCSAGLLALGKDVDAVDTEAAWAVLGGEGSTLHKLFCTRGCALALERMLEEAVVDSPLMGGEDGLVDLSPFATITPIDLQSMSLSEIVKMVLGGQDDSETIFEIYNQHLIPLLKYLSVDHQNSQLDQAIRDFCVDLIQTSEVVFGMTEDGLPNAGTDMVLDDRDDTLFNALKTCTAVAQGSRTAIRKADRIIPSKKILLNLVFTVISEVSQRCQNVKIPRNFCTAIVGMMWEMYESLPASASEDVKEASGFTELMTKADMIYKDLVGLDIISSWPETSEDCFSFAAKRNQLREEKASEDENVKQRLLMLGQDALTSLCRSFCFQAKAQKGAVGLSSLLRHLTSDIQQFFEVCYDSDESFLALLTTTLSSELITPLSCQAEFDLVAQLLTSIDKDWWDPETEAHSIRSYVEAVVFSDGKEQDGRPSPTGNHSLQAAITCQDALGPVFPDLQESFQRSRRYLDAAHFINSVIFSELSVPKEIKPNDLRGDLPLDVVESILRAIPTAIIVGCKEWGEENLAAHANKALRDFQENAAKSPDQADPKNLPPLPGGAVFHLAGILGLEDPASVLVVKSRVVHYGIASGLYGASAAVCRTVMHDQKAFESNADSVTRIATVAEVVSQEKFADLATKKELCLGAICKFQTSTSILTCKPLDAILETYNAIDIKMRKTQQQSERQQVLNIPPPSDAIGSLFKDTWSQYSVNIYELFATLQSLSTSGMVDDSLLNAMSRYVFFSCIFRSSRPRTENAGKLERATVNELLVLGAALLLHIQEKQTFSIPAVQELRQILEKQTIAVINQHPKAFDDPFVIANEELVRQLIGRGFPPMAARWSALATQNAGVQQALQWGIANAKNPRMNDPICQVASQKRVFLEKPSIQQVMNTFTFAGQFLSGTKAAEAWVRKRSSLHSENSSSTEVASAKLGPIKVVEKESRAPANEPPPAKIAPEATAPVPSKSVPAPAPQTAAAQKVTPLPPPPAPAPKPPPKPVNQAPATTAAPVAPKQPAQESATAIAVAPKPPTKESAQSTAAAAADNVAPKSQQPMAPAPSQRVLDQKPVTPGTKPLPRILQQMEVEKKTEVSNPPPPPASAPAPAPKTQTQEKKPVTLQPAPEKTKDEKPKVRTKPTVATKSLPSMQPPAAAAVPPVRNLTVSTPTPYGASNSSVTPTNRPPSLHLGQSTGSSTASDRSTLKHRGEAAMDAVRSKPNTPVAQNMEERRRLIEAGRRLLAKSRENNPVPPPPPKPSSGDSKPAYRRYQPIVATPSPLGVAPPRLKTTVNLNSPQRLTPPTQQSSFFAGSTSPNASATIPKGAPPIDSKQISPHKPGSQVAKVTKLAVADDGWGFDDSEHVGQTTSAPPSRSQPPPPPPPKAPTAAPKPVGASLGTRAVAAAAPPRPLAPQAPSSFAPAANLTTAPAAPPANEDGWDFDSSDLGIDDSQSRHQSSVAAATVAPSQPAVATDNGWDFDSSDLGIDDSQSRHQASEAAAGEKISGGDPVVTKLAVNNEEDDGWDFDDF